MRTLRRVSLAVLALATAPVAVFSCGGGGTSSGTTVDAGADAQGDATTSPESGATTDGGDDATVGDDSGGQGLDGGDATGPDAGDGGAADQSAGCTDGIACGGACCAGGSVCSFQSCVPVGASCHDDGDCTASDFCDYSLGDGVGDGGLEGGVSDGACAPLPVGRCLPRPAACAADAGVFEGGAPACLEECVVHPTAAPAPVIKAAWGGMLSTPFSTDVMMAPVVVPLADTNCDGRVDSKDLPDIVFTSFTGGNFQTNGTLHAVHFVNGTLPEHWSATGVAPGSSVAAGNIDGHPGNEVVACGDGSRTLAFAGDGTPLWSAPYACYMPSIADLDGDGAVEVIVEGGILDGATGALKHAFTPALDSHFVVSDLDADGQLDVVTADRGYHADGTLFVDTKLGGTWPGVADFDHDGVPEVVLVDTAAHAVSLWHYDGTKASSFAVLRGPVDINAKFATNHCPIATYGYSHGGGAPTIADFNGDGTPDVGLAGGIGYVTFDGAKLLDAAQTGANTTLWSQPTTDCSSAQTASAAFDFLGTGTSDVIYSDEQRLRIYDGPTGSVLVDTCNTTGTLVEFPVVADVDGDGHADLVVASNAYASGNAEYQCNDGAHTAQAGVRVIGDANGTWARSPAIWNEHAYHVTNVTPDGTVPQHEPKNYTSAGLDDFRQNKLLGDELTAPDAVVSIAATCPGPAGLVATVRNVGQAPLPAGVVVGFYQGNPPGTRLGQGSTLNVLYPAQSEAVTFALSSADAGLTSSASVYAVVDDGNASHPAWAECRTDNDVSAVVTAACP